MDRNAKAQWKGDLRSGQGTLSSDSGVLSNTPYSFKDRFEQGTGTNPEELLAAAHAGCFSMALSLMLQNEGLKPTASTQPAPSRSTKKEKDSPLRRAR